LGIFEQSEDNTIILPELTSDWLHGALKFEDFLWYSIKRSWVLLMEFPTGIEALRAVHEAVIELTEEGGVGTTTRGAIRDYLASEKDYEFNDNGIRNYPQLLVQMGALTDTNDGYGLDAPPSRFKDRFRKNDLFGEFERRLRREGATVKPPEPHVKRDLMKYYLYRESGGLGKERRWYKTFWKDYLSEKARAGETHQADLQKSEPYIDVTNTREKIFAAVKDRFDHYDSADIRGLSTDVLRRMQEADSPEEAHRIKIAAGSGMTELDLEKLTRTDRPPYTFPDDFRLYDWQQEASDAWFEADPTTADAKRGIAQVVTGAGKTVMALDVIRRWLEANPNGVVTVLVPTKVLMHQWLTEFATKLNVPVADIGWMGSGHKDEYTGSRVVVGIINSVVKDDYAREKLKQASNPPHLLIADECHRYTGEVFSNVFEYHRTASLGLSATPLSQTVRNPTTKQEMAADESIELESGDERLLDELGSIYYTLTYSEGLEEGLIPRFSINYIGFDLTPAEQQTYDTLTRKVSNALSDIRTRHGHRLDSMSGGFNQKLRSLLQSENLSTPEIADYFEYTAERRDLIYDAAARQAITLDQLRQTVQDGKKAIVFQERIEQLERMVAPVDQRGRDPRTGEVTDLDSREELYEMYPELRRVDQELEELFSRAEYRPVMYHSGHSREIWNDFAMEWFREDGFANVMLSVKALIEGVDVPSADVGIVRVSSSSVRQRVQTLGRVLRTGEDATKHSHLYVLYARDTVDEDIFSSHDWKDELTNAEVNHYIWETESGSVDGSLRPAASEEIPRPSGDKTPDIPDPKTLSVGDEYPGPRDGYEITVTSDGDPVERERNRTRKIITPELKEAADFVHEKKGGGTIIINEAGHLITVLPDGSPVFLGVIEAGVGSLEYGEDTGGLSSDAPTSLDDI